MTPLHLSFNQEHSRFAVSTAAGFRIYTCDPFLEFYRREESDQSSPAGIGAVEMLFNSQYFALVGGGPQPQYPINKVMIWNGQQGRCSAELSFRSDVKSVRLRRDRIVVALLNKVLVYNFSDLKPLHQIETADNPKGLCAVSHDPVHMVLVCLGFHKGELRIEHYPIKRTRFVLAHDSRVACLALSEDGKFLATASSKGTLIRIFSTRDGSCLQEVRRGADRAEIYSLAFSSTAEWLAVSSDKGTVHIFNLKVEEPNNGRSSREPLGSNSPLSFMKGVLPRYFNSEWSVAQFRLPESIHHMVAFGHQKNTLVIIGMDGSFYRCQFDPVSGGEMIRLEYCNFLKPNESIV